MNILFTLLFPFFFHQSSIQPETELRWQKERKLTYADFKEAIPAATPWAATTNSGINFSYKSVGRNMITGIDVSASFVPEKSFMKKPVATLLAHEQLHFDITEIFARRFYEEVIKLTSAKKNVLVALFNKQNDECDKWQDQYDAETNHGTNVVMQAMWVEKVTALLQSNDQYLAMK